MRVSAPGGSLVSLMARRLKLAPMAPPERGWFMFVARGKVQVARVYLKFT